MNEELTSRGTAALKEPTPILSLVKRPQLDLATLYRLAGEEPPVPAEVVEQLEIRHKYEGYIRRQEESAAKFAQGEGRRIPPDFDYDGVPGPVPGGAGETAGGAAPVPGPGGPHLRGDPGGRGYLDGLFEKGRQKRVVTAIA